MNWVLIYSILNTLWIGYSMTPLSISKLLKVLSTHAKNSTSKAEVNECTIHNWFCCLNLSSKCSYIQIKTSPKRALIYKRNTPVNISDDRHKWSRTLRSSNWEWWWRPLLRTGQQGKKNLFPWSLLNRSIKWGFKLNFQCIQQAWMILKFQVKSLN